MPWFDARAATLVLVKKNMNDWPRFLLEVETMSEQLRPRIREVTDQAIDGLIADITAAHRLGIPFAVTTTHRKAFRGGGNVVRGSVYEYRIEFGDYEELP